MNISIKNTFLIGKSHFFRNPKLLSKTSCVNRPGTQFLFVNTFGINEFFDKHNFLIGKNSKLFHNHKLFSNTSCDNRTGTQCWFCEKVKLKCLKR